MNATAHRRRLSGLASLYQLTTRQRVVERCELCAAAIAEDHQHLADPQNRQLLCVCNACAILFDGSGATRYRRVSRDVRKLDGLALSDQLWNALAIPVGLAFFLRSGASGTVTAVYPSPAGPTESNIDEELWRDVAALDPALDALADEVEAFLTNRTRGARQYYIVPIDECYKLTGLIRRHWSGFSGGDEVWEQIRSFFDDLARRVRPERIREIA